jgi:predicted dienelactone hydrolase
MAPALGPAFLPDSLTRIDIPVAIVTGAADEIVPVGSGAQFLAAMIPHAELTILPGSGHYVFAGICLNAARAASPVVCRDPPGVDRTAIEAEVARLAVAFFDRDLR